MFQVPKIWPCTEQLQETGSVRKMCHTRSWNQKLQQWAKVCKLQRKPRRSLESARRGLKRKRCSRWKLIVVSLLRRLERWYSQCLPPQTDVYLQQQHQQEFNPSVHNAFLWAHEPNLLGQSLTRNKYLSESSVQTDRSFLCPSPIETEKTHFSSTRHQ